MISVNERACVREARRRKLWRKFWAETTVAGLPISCAFLPWCCREDYPMDHAQSVQNLTVSISQLSMRLARTIGARPLRLREAPPRDTMHARERTEARGNYARMQGIASGLWCTKSKAGCPKLLMRLPAPSPRQWLSESNGRRARWGTSCSQG